MNTPTNEPHKKFTDLDTPVSFGDFTKKVRQYARATIDRSPLRSMQIDARGLEAAMDDLASELIELLDGAHKAILAIDYKNLSPETAPEVVHILVQERITQQLSGEMANIIRAKITCNLLRRGTGGNSGTVGSLQSSTSDRLSNTVS